MEIKKGFSFSFLDFYTRQISLYYKNRSSYSSNTGIIFSIISIIIIIFLVIYNIVKLFNHSTFSIVMNHIIKNNISINLSSTPIMIGIFKNENLNETLNSSIYKLNVELKYLNYTNNENFINFKSIEYENCIYSKYINKYPQINNYNLSNYYCLKSNQEMTIYGKYGDVYNKFQCLSILISKYDSSEYENIIENESNINPYLNLIFLSNIIQHYNYHNPINNSIQTEFFKINKNLFKKIIYSFNHILYKSNEGILLNKIKNIQSFNLKNIFIDFYENEEKEVKNIINGIKYKNIIQIIFSCSDDSIEYIRNYIKINDIISDIGGNIQILLLICKFIVNYFSKKNIIIDISNNLISYDYLKNYKSKEKNVQMIFCVNSNLNLDSNDKNLKIRHNSFGIKNISNSFILNSKNSYIKNYLFLDNKIVDSNIIYKKVNLKLLWKEFFTPFFILKKNKFNSLIICNDIINYYLSIEQILPKFEKYDNYCKEIKKTYSQSDIKKNNQIFKSEKINILQFKNK